MHDRRVLSNDRLTQLLWDHRPPATANAQIHTYMSRLRIKLRPHVTIVRQHQGYLLQTNACWIDFKEFSTLAEGAHVALIGGDFDAAAEGFRAALALCQATALCDVTQYLAEKIGPAWEEIRMAALEGRINADLKRGLDAALVPELTGLVREYPYREMLRAHLMTALHHCDRQTDALAVYQHGRRILLEEVGVDPGEVLMRTHLAVLRGQQWADVRGPAVLS
jgi:DNA-binding SARP family transcriptional activator